MTKTTAELLAESRALRLSFKPVAIVEPLVQPKAALPFSYWYCQVLTNPDFSWEDILINVFTTDGPVGNFSAPENTTVLVHNHSRDERCYTKHMCYVLGYTEKRENED